MGKILLIFTFSILPQWLYFLNYDIDVSSITFGILVVYKGLRTDAEGKEFFFDIFNIRKKIGLIKLKGHYDEIFFAIIFSIFAAVDLSEPDFESITFVPILWFISYRFLIFDIFNKCGR